MSVNSATLANKIPAIESEMVLINVESISVVNILIGFMWQGVLQMRTCGAVSSMNHWSINRYYIIWLTPDTDTRLSEVPNWAASSFVFLSVGVQPQKSIWQFDSFAGCPLFDCCHRQKTDLGNLFYIYTWTEPWIQCIDINIILILHAVNPMVVIFEDHLWK